uniref:Phospholipid/glycerol acyltransferase domain-containing protein n=1 Tax=Panagrolaimus sp. PS1159 TaxID=55785 RepID=A0AC35G298_9BILA
MGEPPVITTSTKFDKCRGAIFGISMLLSAFFGCIYVLMPLAPLIFLHPRFYRRIVDRLVGFWLVMPSALMEYLFGVHLTITGDEIEHSRPAVIIMNHRTRLDWLYFWSVLFRINPWLLTSEKISLKGILKYVPGAGWAMGSNAYMFLERSFENDSKRIDHLIEYYANVGDNYQLLLFPEGTDKCPRATGRSKTFAEKKNIVHYDYVLHPRITGFVHIIQKMRKENYIDHLYDVTIAFNDSIVQSEVDLIKLGVTAQDVRFDIRKISIADLPTTDQELGLWLKNLWVEKEERLRKFYSQSSDTRQLDKLPNAKSFDLTPQNRIFQLLILFMWIILTIGWIYFFLTSNYRFWLALVTIGFYVGLQKIYHGSEMFISKIGLDEWRKRSDSNRQHPAAANVSNGNIKRD